jgi:hypothetical protein
MPFDKAMRHLSVLRSAVEKRDIRLLLLELKDMVPDYNPSKELLERVMETDLERLATAVAHSGQRALTPADSPLATVPAK